jgi:DUF4097 and DUF4098 domain-containing protein YvlB
MTRHVVFVVVGVALISFGVLMLVGCSSGCTWHFNGSGRTIVEGVELPHVATLKASAADAPPRLLLDFESADVTVQCDLETPGIEAEYLVHERTPGDVSITAGAGGVDVRSASGSPFLVKSARIRVPPSTPVRAKTSFGTVRVSGTRGVDEVNASTESGEIRIEAISDVSKVVADASIGRVSLAGAKGVSSISLTSNTGDVSASEVSGAKDVSLRSDIGSVRAQTVDASATVTCETDTGEVDARDVKAKELRLRSDIGSVEATRCDVGHLSAHTDIGSVELVSCTYETKDIGSDLGGVVERK